MSRKNIFFEIATLVIVLALSVVAIWGTIMENPSYAIVAVSSIGLCFIAFTILRFTLNPDHLRAKQSEHILHIANETQTFLIEGLTRESAQAVCRLLLPATDAIAVAVTDTKSILGFAGVGEDHHAAGGKIRTRATKETIEDGRTHLLRSKKEIGCSDVKCGLNAAITVPLDVLDRTVGTLKFYYTSPRQLTENRIAMAKGIGNLLSTQLGISELDRQADLTMRAELRALQSQINPHFLFNTINTIAALIRTDPMQARILLREFAVFYRRVLENADDLIPLDSELEQTSRYLGFEMARFGDYVTVETTIEPGLEGVLVPAFVIQPIVENAINHAMIPDKLLTIKLHVYSDGDDVVISVEDDGIGIPQENLEKLVAASTSAQDSPSKGMGIALKNVNDRLQGYFGEDSGIHVMSELGIGTTVQLIMYDAMKRNWR